MAYTFEDGGPAQGALGGYTFEDEAGPSILDVAKQTLGTGFIADTARGLGFALEKGGIDYGTRMRQAGDWFEEEVKGSMTPGGRAAAEANVFEGEGLSDLRLGDDWGGALAMGAARSVPQMAMMAIPGGALSSGIRALPGMATAARGAGLAGMLARTAPGAIGYGAAEGVQAGLLNAAGMQSEIEGMDPLELAKRSPRFTEILESLPATMPVEERVAAARQALAEEAAASVFKRTAPWTAGVGMLTGGGALGALERGARSLPRAVGKGVASEAIQEAPQSGGEAFIEGLVRSELVDPSIDPTKGVAAAAASGGAIGGVTGGVFGGAGHIVRPREPQEIVPAQDPHDQALRRVARTVERQREQEIDAEAPPAAPGASTAAPAAGGAPAAPTQYEREGEALRALKAGEELLPEDAAYLTSAKLATVGKGGALRILPAGRRRLTELMKSGRGDATRDAPIEVKTSADVEAAAERARTDYTPPQGEANNVQRAHVEWEGLGGTIEVARGGTRRGTNPRTGEAWETTHREPYGYWKGTKGADGMHVDVVWGPELERGHPVYVLDEIDEKGDFRQHKTLPGFASEQAAREAYLGISSKRPEHIGAVTAMPVEQFKQWLKGDTTKPVAYRKGSPAPAIAEARHPDTGKTIGRTPDGREIVRMPDGQEAEIPHRDPEEGTSIVVDTARSDIRSAATGKPFRAPLMRGEGWKEIGLDSPYNPAAGDAPLLGPGRYTTSDIDYAATFGRVSTHDVSLDNPLVISSDQQWRALTEKAGWEYPLPTGLPPERIEADVRRLREQIEASGHDGVIVSIPEDENKGKTLGRAFGADQVIEFKTRKGEKHDDGKKQLSAPGQQAAVEQPAQGQQPAAEARAAAAPAGPAKPEGVLAQGDIRDVGYWWDKELTAAGRVQLLNKVDPSKRYGGKILFRNIETPGLQDKLRALKGTNDDPMVRERAVAATPAFGEKNKVFTADAAARARELLKKKLGQVNAGLDPEVVQAGIQLAGYYIEGGARSFADYSAKMIADLGEVVRPYLKSWYLAVRNWPGFDNAGMQSEAQLEDRESQRPIGEQQGALPAWAPEYTGWRALWTPREVSPGKWRMAGVKNGNPISPSFGSEADAVAWADQEWKAREKVEFPEGWEAFKEDDDTFTLKGPDGETEIGFPSRRKAAERARELADPDTGREERIEQADARNDFTKGVKDMTEAASKPPAPRWMSFEINPAVQEGWLVVRDGEQSLARFRMNGTHLGKVEHYFESESTRGPVRSAIEAWMAREAVEPAGDRKKDDDGKPIYEKGERVEIIGGPHKGRHGVIAERNAITTSVLGLSGRGIGEQSRKTSYHYTIKSDNGAEFFVYVDEFKAETSPAPSAVPDIQYEGRWYTPEEMLRSVSYDRSNAKNAWTKGANARLPARKREAKAEGDRRDAEASRKLAAFEAWAEKYPVEAKAARGDKQAAPLAAAPASVPAKDGQPGMSLVESKHTKTGQKLWVVTLAERVERDAYNTLNAKAKSLGGYYSSYRGGGAVPGFTFKEEAKAREFMGQTPAATPSAPAKTVPLHEQLRLANQRLAPLNASLGVGRNMGGEQYLFADKDGKDIPQVKGIGFTEAGIKEAVNWIERNLGKSAAETLAAAPAAAPQQAAQQLLEEFDDGTIETANDLALRAEEVASETGNEDLAQAARAFFEARREDMEEDGGRGDADEYGDALKAAIARVAGVSDIPAVESRPGRADTGSDDVELPTGVPGRARGEQPAEARPPAPDEQAGERPAGDRPVDAGRRGAPDAGTRDGVAGRPGPVEPAGELPGERAGDESGAGERARDPDAATGGTRNRPARAPGTNYRVSNADELGKGSWKQKARQNIEAIRTLKRIINEERQATPEEQAVMVKYVGWGASELANNIFESYRQSDGTVGGWGRSQWGYGKGYQELGAELKALLTDDEYKRARESTQNAHYTSQSVIRAMWRAMTRLGFDGGRILEPGMGVGHFLGLAPEDMAGKIKYTGVELDPSTGHIAKLLYPQSDVRVMDFTKFVMPNDFYDAAIGNPPFADIVIKSDKAYRKFNLRLHDYFFAKALDKVRPGGVLMFVTSKGTMDKQDADARRFMADRADLLGAIRLPQDAFKENAGTEVITDVLFFKKRAPGQAPSAEAQAWLDVAQIQTPDGPTEVNEYFARHPDMMLGDPRLSGGELEGGGKVKGLYRAEGEFVLQPREGLDTEQAFNEAVDRLPAGVYEQRALATPTKHEHQAIDISPDEVKESGYYLKDGKLYQRRSGVGVKPDISGFAEKIVRSFIPVRDAVKDVIRTQLESDDAKALKAAQAKLAKAYDAFVAKHGPINKEVRHKRTTKEGDEAESVRTPNISAFSSDPEAYRVAAIEQYDHDSGKAMKRAIFTERVINAPTDPETATPQDALVWSLNEYGRVELAAMAERLGKKVDDIVKELGDAIFQDPATQQWVTDDEYLSGDVRTRLALAEDAAKADRAFQRNVEALKKVQPRDLKPSEIYVRLGAPWIATDYIQDFAESLGLNSVKVSHVKEGAMWGVTAAEYDKRSVAAVSDWGTDRMNAVDLLDSALNARSPRIYDIVRDGESEKRVFNEVATQAAQEKLVKLQQRFSKWIFEDGERATALAEIYNRDYNNIVPRQFDGKHLTLPGLSSAYKPYDHQRRVAWRIIQRGNTYMAHEVGAGKTIAASIAGIEMRRLGLVKKVGYVVPKHMLRQFATEMLALYPAAKVLVADEENFDAKSRQTFLGRVQSENWDAVIFAHSSFGFVPVSEDFAATEIQAMVDLYEEMLADTPKSDRVKRKQLERQLKRFREKLEAVTDQSGKDKGMTFEETGIDFLFVDEAHNFRKLDFPTNQTNVKGVTGEGSKRAMDLFFKVRYIESLHKGRSIVLMSGTPITNTIGEMFTVQRFLQLDLLKERSIDNFDAWAAMFGEQKTKLEPQPDGSYKPVTRFAQFVNMPELAQMWGEIGDVVMVNDMPYMKGKRPAVKGGRMQIIVGAQTEAQSAYKKELARRIQEIEARKGPPKKGDDIILSVINDGRHAAMDQRFIDPGLPAAEGSKLEKLIAKAYDIWERTKDKRLTQMIFSDLGTPSIAEKRGFSAYLRIRDALIAKGVPASEIMFIQDADTDDKKLRLFKQMNSGEKRILIGGAGMQEGVNAQRLLYALHNLDAPFLPAAMSQRRGRIERQGNTNPEIELYGYVTKGSYDEQMFGILETKQRFIEQFLRGNPGVRTMEDVDSEADAFSEAQALASDDPRILQLAGLRTDLRRLEMAEEAHYKDQSNLKYARERANRDIANHTKHAAVVEANLARVKDTKGDKFAARLGGKDYTDREEAGKALIAQLAAMQVEKRGIERQEIGEIGGFTIVASADERPTVLTDEAGKKTALRSMSWHLEGIQDLRFGSDFGLRLEDSSPMGSIRALENAVQGLPGRLKHTQEALEAARKVAADANAKIGAKFEQTAELAEVRKKLEDLEGVFTGEAKAKKDAAKAAAEGKPAEEKPDAGADDVRFSRQADDIERYRFQRGEDKQGMPAFANHEILLARADKDLVSRGEDGQSYTWFVYDRTKPGEKGAKFLKVGMLYADLGNDGKFKVLRNIQIYSRFRKKGVGYGESIVASLLAHNGLRHRMVVDNIVHHTPDPQDDALPFWRKMGVRLFNYSTNPDTQVDGDLELGDYLKARGERSSFSRDAERQGPEETARARQAPGAAGGQAGARENEGADGARADAGGAGSRSQVLGREPEPVQGLTPAAVRRLVEPLVARWGNAPEVVVIASMAEAPAPVQARNEGEMQKGALGKPSAFIYRGKVYVVADGVNSPYAVYRAIFHEVLGHHGLRGAFGEELVTILHDVVRSQPDKVKAKAFEYGLDWNNEDAKLEAAEEVLAEIAQRRPHANLVKRAIAAIRRFLRDVLGLPLKLSENDIIVNFILPARRFVEGAKRGVDADTTRFARPEPWYFSQLRRAVEASKQGAAPAAQWKGTIKAMKGISPEEIEWSGLNEWLDMWDPKDRVPKDVVLDYLAKNGVRVGETVLGGSGRNPATSEGDRLIVELDALGYDVSGDPDNRVDFITRRADGTEFFYVNEGIGGEEGFFTQDGRDDDRPPQNVERLALQLYRATVNEIDADEDGTRYRQYALPGGQNYRELLLTLPLTRGGEEAEALFQSTHFGEPNILAHVRFNERTDAEGKKVLFVEEIQSDWAQKGKREGFRAEGMTPAKEARFKELSQKMKDRGRRGLTEAERDEIASLDRLWQQEVSNQARPPRAPFVGKTEAWVSLALKRMIRWAAENGFDRVAWTTGEQQADRYDLSKHIDTLRVAVSYRMPDGPRYTISGDKDGSRVLDRELIREGDLADYIGKDLAGRAIEELKGGKKVVEYAGLDLRVGGHGMRAFYNDVLPKIANRLLEKLGGGKVGRVRVAGIGDADIGAPGEYRIVNADKGFVVEGKTDDGWQEVAEPVATREEAVAVLDDMRELATQTQHGFAITDKLRDAALGGLPLFSRVPAPARQDLDQGRRRFLGQLLALTASSIVPAARAEPAQFAIKDGPLSLPLKWIAENSDNQIYRELVPMLLPKVQDVPLRVIHPGTYYANPFPSSLRYARGATQLTSKGKHEVIVYVRADTGMKEDTVMHESVHGATMQFIRANPEHAAVKRLEELRKEVIDATAGEADPLKSRIIKHGTKNLDEFLAWGMTDPEFQKVLRGIQVEKKTAWQSFVDVIARMLGIDPTDGPARSALEELMDAGLHILEEAKAGGGIFGTVQGDVVLAQEDTRNAAFKKWFGNSKVVDADGKPMVVYHGTRAESFSQFEADFHDVVWSGKEGKRDLVFRTFYFSDDKETAATYGENVVDTYLSLQNPKIYNARGATWVNYNPFGKIADAKYAGHDGAIIRNVRDDESGHGEPSTVYVAFEPEQIKSATDNAGTFDPDTADIRFQRQSAEAVREGLDNLFTSQRTFNRWWHRTVGTQFHKAKKDRHFRKVFNLGQDYLTDTSRYAMLAEKEAPNLLLRLEGAGDILKLGISRKDREAIATPIFEGTLDNKTWSDEELAERYHLNERQRGYYREFRAAVDRSLDELGKSTMAKMAKGIGIQMNAVMDLRDLPLERFHGELADLMKARAKLLKDAAEQMDDADPAKALALERADSAKTQLRATTQLFNRIEQLKKEGYAPLMRFGEYTVYVTEEGPEGGTEQVFFGLYESQREANAAAKALAIEYPDAAVEQGILSKDAWRVFQGLSPDTVEVFAKAAGLDQEPLFQEYLRLAVNNRSALKRLIHRKGIPGFSQDVTRVLASFVTSNARLTSSHYHLGEMQAAVEAIPKAKGDVRDEAVNLWKYLADPVEEAGAVRGFLFFQFLGGSIASAMVNATQPITMTAPYLAKYADPATVGAELGKATLEAARNKPGADVRAAYERAADEGIIAPHEIYQLMAQARGNAMGSSGIGRAMKVWGSFFSLAEAFNRRATFLAAYRIAVKNGARNPYAFAKDAVHETQGLYNKGNRPNWARGSMGATIFTFKQFSIAYVEFLKRLHDTNPKAFWLALAILMLAAGLEGMPFAEDLEDLIDTIGQWLGYATNSKRWLRDRAAEALGEGGSAFVLHGLSAIPGVPLDVSLRMGLHNLIPGTALFKRSEAGESKAREALEVAGPIGGVAQQAGRALERAAGGDPLGAARAVMPVALANLFKGAEMWEKGYYTDTRGRRILDTTQGEAILKAAGFQPASVAKESRNLGIIKETIDLHRVTEDGIADKWARAIVDQDQEKIDEARGELESWNRKNPDAPIVINFPQIHRRVLEMRRTRAERFTKSAPRELRGTAAREISR
jgi:N12 class adenine-specific DNA methylase